MLEKLQKAVELILGSRVQSCVCDLDELTVEIAKEDLLEAAGLLRDHDDLLFEQLIDLCGVDYLTYGQAEWTAENASGSGFSRGRQLQQAESSWQKPRFAVVYHLLSVTLNQRLRLKVFVEQDDMMLPSVVELWSSANWYEREAFDLFGLLFEGHPDLRRILTDYGFIGHPFRKDFPVIGELEMRFDETLQQCVYEPVSIEERVNVARVIRKDIIRKTSI